MKITNSFTLSLLGLVALVTMFLAKGLDTSGAVVTICLGYVGARAGQKASMVIASSKDSTSNTDEIIKQLKD